MSSLSCRPARAHEDLVGSGLEAWGRGHIYLPSCKVLTMKSELFIQFSGVVRICFIAETVLYLKF